MFKGKKETDMFREGKKLTRKQAILANCYICNGENEGGVDCLGGKNCPLYQYNPYGGLKKRANGTFPGSKSIVALPMIVFLVALLLSATTSFLVARGETIDKPNAPSVEIDSEKLADAIYKAENSQKYPYGIKSINTHSNHAYARKICLNSIKNAKKRYCRANSKEDFISFMSRRYCPIGAKDDPKGLNKNWVRNVTRFYKKEVR